MSALVLPLVWKLLDIYGVAKVMVLFNKVKKHNLRVDHLLFLSCINVLATHGDQESMCTRTSCITLAGQLANAYFYH